MANSWSRQYSACSPDRLFQACLRTVTRLNWKIQHTDGANRTLSCAAKGKKIRLGGGQDVSLVVEEVETRTARVVLGWGYQAARLFDHGEKDEISGLFFETLKRVFPEVPEPVEPTPPGESSSSIADLERLADLHDRGILTDEEFRLAKARVLDS